MHQKEHSLKNGKISKWRPKKSISDTNFVYSKLAFEISSGKSGGNTWFEFGQR